MKKVTIKNLIDFRLKSDRAKKTFLNNLKLEKPASSDGGDYWISCVSAISNSFKYNDDTLLGKKVEEIKGKMIGAVTKNTKTQYQRNIDILINFEDFELHNIRPTVKIQILKQPKDKSLIDIGGLPIESKPSHVFSFSESGSEEIGAVWFVAKLEGYSHSEIGMFADMIFRYLDKHYSKNYFVNTTFCIAVDVFSGKVVRFTDIENGTVPSLIEATIDQINKL